MTEETNSHTTETKPDDEVLKTLLDSNYPLLTKFRDACPGSFKHSQSLASMVDGVSIEVNLNVVGN